MKHFFNTIFLSTAISLSSVNAATPHLEQSTAEHSAGIKYLSTKDRPVCLEHSILRNDSNTSTLWTLNGEYEDTMTAFHTKAPAIYNFFWGANADDIVLSYILKHPDQREFNILDFGAGKGGFLRRLAESINPRIDSSKKFSINIYGLTGGNYKENFGNPAGQIGSCSIVYIDDFNIELIKESIGLRHVKFDLVFSRSTFQHLVDPLGTLTDVFKKLRAGGFFIGDMLGGFAHMIINDITPDIANTLMNFSGTPLAGRCYHLALQRTSDKELLLPIAYDSKKPVIDDASGKRHASYVRTADSALAPDPQLELKHMPFWQNSPNILDFLLSSTVLDDSISYQRQVFYLGLKKKMESHPDTPISQLILTEKEFAASAREYKALPDKEHSTFLMQDIALLKRAKELEKQVFDRETTDMCKLLKPKAK